MDKGNAMKTALVTGGTRGIGAAIAIGLRDAGYRVIASYIANDDVAAEFSRRENIEVVKFDVCDFNACQTAVEEIGRVDILINNAGITKDRMLHKMDPADWQSVMDTNLSSCFSMCRAVINGMRERHWGRIINISSINGQKGQMGQANYSAAKAGMIGLTKALAQESASKGITVNAICPGYIETEMTAAMRPDILDSIIGQIPVGRMGKPEEVAAMVCYLVDEKAAFMTGATLSANGGQYMA